MIKLGKLFIIYCLKPVTNSVAFLLLASKLASGGTEASVWPPMILRNKSGGHLILSEEYAVLVDYFLVLFFCFSTTGFIFYVQY